MKLGVEMTMEASRAERAVAAFSKKADQAFQSVGKELSDRISSAFTAGAVVSAVGTFIGSVRQSVDEIKDLSDQLGISTDEVQRLQKAANDTGVKFGVVTTALQRIESLRAQALSGDSKASGLFATLGANPNSSALEILKVAAEQASKSTEKNAAAFDLLGKKAVVLRNIVSELNAQGGIRLISQDQIADLDRVQANLEETQRLMKAAASPGLATLFRGATGILNIFNPENRKRMEEIAAMRSRGEISLGKRIELEAMSLLGMQDEEGKKYEALNLQEALKGRRVTSPVKAEAVAKVPAAASVSLGSQGDALSRIGLFVGGRPEVGALRNIEASTRQTAEASRQTVTELRTLADVLKYYVGGE